MKTEIRVKMERTSVQAMMTSGLRQIELNIND